MEQTPPPGLVWADALPDACLFTGEPIALRETRLELVGTGDPPEPAVLGWSEGAQCWYAPFDDLMEWSYDAEVSPADAGPFRVDGREQETFVHMSGPDKTVPWATFAAQLGDVMARHAAAPPTEAEVRALPELLETWQLAVGEAGYVDDEGGRPVPVNAVVVTDGGGQPRAVQVHEGAFDATTLAATVRTATRVLPGTALTAARPRAVLVEDEALAADLAAVLAASGIAVRPGPTPLAWEAIDDLHVLGAEGGPAAPPLIAADDDATVLAYLDAAAAFYAAAPWTRLRGNAFLAVQDLDLGLDAPWLYVNVMGQEGTDPGLSVFTDWLDACSLAHAGARGFFGPTLGGPPVDPHVEGVSLLPLTALDPADADRLKALGAPPTFHGAFALPTFIDPDGVEPPTLPLDLYTALLTAIPAAVAKRRAKVVTSITATVEAADYRLAIRYPAHGAEGLSARTGDVRLTMVGGPEHEFESLKPGERLIVEGPAATRAHVFIKAIERAFAAAGRWGYVTALALDDEELWHNRAFATDPSPTLDHLAAAEAVALQMGFDVYDLHVERLPPGAAPTLHARII